METCKDCHYYSNDIGQQDCNRYPSIVKRGPDQTACGEFIPLIKPEDNTTEDYNLLQLQEAGVMVNTTPAVNEDPVILPGLGDEFPLLNEPKPAPIKHKAKRGRKKREWAE